MASTVRETDRITVGTSAVRLDGGNGPDVRVIVRNLDATNAVYLGPAGVTTSTGFPLLAGETYDERTNPTTAPLYAISAGSVAVAVMALD
jgi:hypothetical protein